MTSVLPFWNSPNLWHTAWTQDGMDVFGVANPFCFFLDCTNPFGYKKYYEKREVAIAYQLGKVTVNEKPMRLVVCVHLIWKHTFLWTVTEKP